MRKPIVLVATLFLGACAGSTSQAGAQTQANSDVRALGAVIAFRAELFGSGGVTDLCIPEGVTKAVFDSQLRAALSGVQTSQLELRPACDGDYPPPTAGWPRTQLMVFERFTDSTIVMGLSWIGPRRSVGMRYVVSRGQRVTSMLVTGVSEADRRN
jgi:hypothetical protein